MARHWRETVVMFVTVSNALACGRPGTPTPPSSPSPTPPSSSGPSAPAGTYTISGLITAYRGGPLKNAGVVRFHCNTVTNPFCTTQTDDQGHYALSGVSDVADIGAWKTGYQSVWKASVTPQHASVDFVLYQGIT